MKSAARLPEVDRRVLFVLREMKYQGRVRATVAQVMKRLPGGLPCPNDVNDHFTPICSVGVLGAMERVKRYV